MVRVRFLFSRAGDRGKVTGFETLGQLLSWRPIPNCPGRSVLRGGLSSERPADLVGRAGVAIVEERRIDSAKVTDPVVLIRFSGGGLLSYRKASGGYVHTLNTVEGLERKLMEILQP